jgi:hypothetical protein
MGELVYFVIPNNNYLMSHFCRSAKAIPFIQRGIFFHPTGPKEGLPLSLTDIFSVSL